MSSITSCVGVEAAPRPPDKAAGGVAAGEPRVFPGRPPAVQQKFEIPNAVRERAAEIRFAQPVTVDRLEMEFFDPVLELADGQRVPPALVNPGYAEIELISASEGR
jgi:hypothetical protein